MTSYGLAVYDANGNDLFDSDGIRSTMSMVASGEGAPGTYTLSQFQDSPTWLLDVDFYLPRTLSVMVQLEGEAEWDADITGGNIPIEALDLWLDNEADTERTGATPISAPLNTAALISTTEFIGSFHYIPVCLVASTELVYNPQASFPGWHTAALTGWGGSNPGYNDNVAIGFSRITVWQLGG